MFGGMRERGPLLLVVFLLGALSCADAPTPNIRRPRRTSPVLVGTGETTDEVCWSTINAYRKKIGLAPYKRWTDGEDCALGQAKSDAAANEAHSGFGKCDENAQNECPDYPGPADKWIPECLADMWDEGPGGIHYDNMTSTKFTKVACGIHTTSKGSLWSVQNFR
jgi:hypothetical protein